MTVKSETCLGMIVFESREELRDLLRIGAPRRVARNDPAHLLLHALRHHLLEIIQAALGEICFAKLAVLAPSMEGVQRVLQIHDHFQPVVVQARNGLERHQQVLFRSRLQRLRNIQQPRFNHHHRHGNALLVAHHDLYVGPLLHLAAAPARSAEQRQLHRPCIDRTQCAGQVANKLVRSGKPNLRVAHAKLAHPIQQADGIGHRYVQVRLLQPVAQTGVEQLDSSSSVLLHLSLFPVVKVSFVNHPSKAECRTFIIPVWN